MSLEEAKSIIKAHGIVPSKILGQNFMIDGSIYPKLANYASLTGQDTVLDAGAGFGFLTRFLALRCKHVFAVEKDPEIVKVLCEQVKNLVNISVIKGDFLRVNVPSFNKAISIPPYYLSSDLVIWLLDRRIDCAVLILQKEFAYRLAAPVNSEEYGWLAIVIYQAAQVEVLDAVPKWMFYPEPNVDSAVVAIKPWAKPKFAVKNEDMFRRMVKWLFTQRNKKLQNALVPFIRSELKLDRTKATQLAFGFLKKEKRPRELTPEEFGAIADVLS